MPNYAVSADDWLRLFFSTIFDKPASRLRSQRKARMFRSCLGIPPEVLCLIFKKVTSAAFDEQHNVANGSAAKVASKPLLLLYGLHFLKTYPTGEQGAAFWGIQCVDTYRSYIRIFFDALDASLADQISMSHRFNVPPAAGYFEDIWLVLDATVCPSERPSTEPLQRLMFEGRKKKHGFKYEIAVRIRDGHICWVAGPIPASFHDITLYRLFSLWSFLREDEQLLADKGYVGEASIRAPARADHAMSVEERALNLIHEQGRIIVEHVFSVLKRFKILRGPYRLHSKLPHHRVFLTCARIANLLFTVQPVVKHECDWIGLDLECFELVFVMLR